MIGTDARPDFFQPQMDTEGRSQPEASHGVSKTRDYGSFFMVGSLVLSILLISRKPASFRRSLPVHDSMRNFRAETINNPGN
jgi:hypothetical protein